MEQGTIELWFGIGHRKRATIDNMEAGVESSVGRCDMRRSLIAMAAVLLSGVIGGANEKPPVVQDVIHATPEKIKKAALAMLVPDGYTVAYYTASQLKISRQWSSEETIRFNTDHWTNAPVSNCQHVLTLILLPVDLDEAISVTMRLGSTCHADGGWRIWTSENEKDVQWMQNTLADLKAKIEKADQRH